MRRQRQNKQLNRWWLRVLEIAKSLFEKQWYHTKYLEETEGSAENGVDMKNLLPQKKKAPGAQHQARRLKL